MSNCIDNGNRLSGLHSNMLNAVNFDRAASGELYAARYSPWINTSAVQQVRSVVKAVTGIAMTDTEYQHALSMLQMGRSHR